MHTPILIATLTDPYGRQAALWEPDTLPGSHIFSLGGGLSHDLPAPGLPVDPVPAAMLLWDGSEELRLQPTAFGLPLEVDGCPVQAEGADLSVSAQITIDGLPFRFERGPLNAEPAAPVALRGQAITHTGYVRAVNEDSLLVTELGAAGGNYPRPLLLAVMDGCGGHAAGEVASGLVREALADWAASLPADALAAWSGSDRAALWETAQSLRLAFLRANARVRVEAQRRPSECDMATTLSVALSAGGWLLTAHVGDSRIYLLRDNTLCRLTCDHNRPARMAREGLLSWKEVDSHPQSHVLTQIVGGQPTHTATAALEVGYHRLWPGDRLLLCSDGLTRMVAEAPICAILRPEMRLEQSADLLLVSALAAGAEDNVTLIAVEVAPVEAAGLPALLPAASATDALEIPIDW
jgi:serine/threonine protein phosphatase PrpC